MIFLFITCLILTGHLANSRPNYYCNVPVPAYCVPYQSDCYASCSQPINNAVTPAPDEKTTTTAPTTTTTPTTTPSTTTDASDSPKKNGRRSMDSGRRSDDAGLFTSLFAIPGAMVDSLLSTNISV
ncbi:uncharacterized protein LOC113234557 [Hyposmocoma kahamanoa]|uniref:uncharacterized protein LOC113234557 n=1 Tax=Hyposmocoma kahamanoa TaxID=1477025 RepID=UPI000E6D7E9A|nr:uncharacterized protein LOC113234557 [Hyposmocoma kahamanoa]